MHAFAHKPDLPTLLLIDDDMVSREVMATVLTMTGYLMHTAASGEASLELLDGGGCVPAVILMDAQMPGLNGAPLIKEIRKRTTARVVAISASRAPDDVLAASDGFLLKPFGAEAIRKLLEGEPSDSAATVGPAEPLLDAAAPVVNPETLAQLREMMPEAAAKEIYAAIIADLYKRVDALEAAIAKNDHAEVRRIGHAIKGGCGMAGALQAARLGAMLEAGALENEAKTGRNQLDNSGGMLGDLRAAAHNLESMLNQEFPA